MPATIVWTEEEISKIVFAYTIEKQAFDKIAERFECSPSSVRKVLTNAGVSIQTAKQRATKYHWTDEQLDDITYLYEVCKLTLEEIGKKYSCNPKTIRNALVSKNVDINDPHQHHIDNKLTDYEIQRIIFDYSQEMSIQQLAPKYNRCVQTIEQVLKDNEVTLRVRGDHSKFRRFNKSFFNADSYGNLSEEASYWFGFILGDGHINSNKGTYILSIGLAICDKSHLEKFRVCLNSNHLILETQREGSQILNRKGEFQSIKSTKSASIKIDSKEIFQDLYDHGKRKFNESVLTVPINIPMLRGLVDSDGTFGYLGKNPSLRFYGGEILLTQVRDWLNTNHGFPANNVRYNQHTLYQVAYSGNTAIRLINLLYKDAPELLRLERKYNKYLQLFTESL